MKTLFAILISFLLSGKAFAVTRLDCTVTVASLPDVTDSGDVIYPVTLLEQNLTLTSATDLDGLTEVPVPNTTIKVGVGIVENVEENGDVYFNIIITLNEGTIASAFSASSYYPFSSKLFITLINYQKHVASLFCTKQKSATPNQK